MRMKKFMTTATKTPAAVAAASPSPTSTFSFETMLREQAAARSGSSVPESGEDTAASQPATPTAIQPVTPRPDETSSREVRSVRGATLARLPPTAISDSATPTPASTSPPSSTSTGVVKMCGYLKKKRNKMGGWRKLFFVLQNRLLLSYSSRDDYEKKLAPFKDIINLVPGTIIIPTTGPRFTIETNSKLMYTFRCDDHRCCSEWIMALLDSLTAAANGGLSADRNFSLHNGFHRSTLPLPSYALPSNCQPFAGVVSRSGGPALVLMKRAPQAPASLLVRSGPPKLPRSLQPTETATAAAAVAPAGRSHGPARLSPPESNEDEDDLNNNVLSVGDCLANNSLSKSRDSGAKMPGSGEDGDTRRRPGRLETVVTVESINAPGSGLKNTDAEQTPKGDASITADRAKSVDEDGTVTAASGDRAKEGKETEERPSKQQIFRLHQDVWSKAHRQSMDVCRINSMFNERQPALTASTMDGARPGDRQPTSTAASLQQHVVEGEPSGEAHLYEDISVERSPIEPEPIYAVVDVRAKRSRRLARTLSTTPDGADRADGSRKVSVSLPQISDGAELVGAVADRRPATARSCSNYDDYEDVNYLFVGQHQRSLRGGTETDSVGTEGSREQLQNRDEPYGEEHIYEPILVADRIPSVTTGSSASLPAPATDHSHSLWRHLKRMHLQGSWRRLTHRHGGSSKSEEPSHGRSATATALEGLGRRLDNHRRSIKKRIKNLCDRIDPIPASATAHQPQGSEAAEPETSTGVKSRKSVSLDSFLLAKGQHQQQQQTQKASVPRC